MKEFFVGFEVGGGSEEVAEGFFFDVGHEFFEEFVGFVFVFNEGVFLALGAEADAIPKGVHVVEVLLPLTVDGDEDDLAFEVVEGLGDLVFDFEFVGVFDFLDEEGGDFFGAHLFEAYGVFIEAEGEGDVGPANEF